MSNIPSIGHFRTSGGRAGVAGGGGESSSSTTYTLRGGMVEGWGRWWAGMGYIKHPVPACFLHQHTAWDKGFNLSHDWAALGSLKFREG